MIEKFKLLNIKNIVIFVSDSLRWDCCPKEIMKMGLTFKTIASSTHTCTSFPSIVSGLYPPKHGIWDWNNKLSKNKQGLFNFKRYNISLWTENTWIDFGPNESGLHNLFNNPPGVSLDQIKEPFIYIEDDKGGHAPYGFQYKDYKGSFHDFFKEYGKKEKKELIKQYKKGIEQSFKVFKKKLKILKKRNLLKNTLAIFTSDHGELLGEYGGLVGHGHYCCPELVYVPTIFIHSSIKPKIIKDNIMKHVDIYPTIADFLGMKIEKVDGISLFNKNLSKIGMNFYKIKKRGFKKIFQYELKSIWDYNGGHVFNNLNFISRFLLFFYRLFFKKGMEIYIKENFKKIVFYEKINKFIISFKYSTSSYLKFGKPNISKKKAKKIIKRYLKKGINIKNKESVIDNKIKEKLKKLGYLD